MNKTIISLVALGICVVTVFGIKKFIVDPKRISRRKRNENIKFLLKEIQAYENLGLEVSGAEGFDIDNPSDEFKDIVGKIARMKITLEDVCGYKQ
jgi:hypothetical protein